VAPGFTVQVAAYPARAAADSLAARLRDRGYQSRVFGTAAPFRVRVGRYATEAAADSVERALKAKGMEGFVTAAEAVTP
jgi:cell division protein FtsN